jgi:enoyl-CoA hydratase
MTKAINEQCPLSLGVIHRLIHLAKNKTLKECFIQDFNLAQKYAVDPNFAEGVRTVLVDRGSEPNWSHKHVLQVTQ